MSLGLLFLIIGCENEASLESVNVDQYEAFQRETLSAFEDFKKSGKVITVEKTTLEELNNLLIDHGLEPIEKSKRRSRSTRTEYCEYIAFLADANFSGSVTGADIIVIRQYLLSIGQPVPAQGGFIEPTLSIHPIHVSRYGFVSQAYCSNEGSRLDIDDEDIVTDFILGFICE
jgi:hypothetical protein